jgi:hypothetical protein
MQLLMAGVNQVGSGTAWANGAGSGTVAGNAFDGNLATYWWSGSVFPYLLQYDFGSGQEKDIDQVIIKPDPSYWPRSFEIQYSDNGTDWTTVDSVTNIPSYSSYSWPVPTGRLWRGPLRRDMYDGGVHHISNTVDELGVNGAYRVRLFDRASARCIGETWSAADGSYSFPNIAYRANGYFAVAYDHGENLLNAAIADLLTPEAMP